MDYPARTMRFGPTDERLGELRQELIAVHADSHCFNRPFIFQPCKRGIGAFDDLAEVTYISPLRRRKRTVALIRIMNECDIDSIGLEPL
jgi:hypothetical protein